jgi:hypothetical protein
MRKHVTYANVAVTLALVFAMSGGAYAASKILITSTKQISPSVLKALKGKSGSNGATGAAGPAGPQGPAGPAGAQGPAGPKGDAGAPGAKGETGAKGEAGAPGQTGFTSTLPPGKTERGAWGMAGHAGQTLTEPLRGAISFNIPLKAPIDEAHVHVVAAETPASSDPPGCTGTISEPGAEPGFACLFEAGAENVAFLIFANQETSEGGAGRSGISLVLAAQNAGYAAAYGLWVVTAP